jgi:uncharacterized protein
MKYVAKMMLFVIVGFVSAVVVNNKANCQPKSDSADIRITTGSEAGVYYQLGNDIKELLKESVNIEVLKSEGSVMNMSRLLKDCENEKKTDCPTHLGIVQKDVFLYYKNKAAIQGPSENAHRSYWNRISDELGVIFFLHKEEVHLFANTDIKKVDHLKGKRIAIGTYESGTWITAQNILQYNKIALSPCKNDEEKACLLQISIKEGIAAVLHGLADAAFFVVGKPAPIFNNLAEANNFNQAEIKKGFHFVEIENRDARVYSTSRITSKDYPNSWVNQDVNTIAVRAILVSSRNEKLCERINQLANAIKKKKESLKKSNSKWEDIDLEKRTSTLLKLDECVKIE